MSVEAHKRLFTVEEFHRMGEAGILHDDARLELWAGEIIEMPPISPGHHGDVNVLNMTLVRAIGDRGVISVQGPVILDDYYEPLPDVAVLRPREDFYRSSLARPPDILLLIEVADTPLRRDRLEKVPKYAAAGIPQTWVLDVSARRLEVYCDPSPDGYRTTAILGAGDEVSPVALPDIVLSVDDLLG